MAWELFKAHGLGNDYLACDRSDLGEPSPAQVRLLCDRHRGPGADGLLLRIPPRAADAAVRIFNPDGTEAEKSGNGLRIFAAYLHRRGACAPATPIRVETAGGMVGIELRIGEGPAMTASVEMGQARFGAAAVELTGAPDDALAVALDAGDGPPVEVVPVSLGNPHCVVFRDRVGGGDLRTLGPRLSTHPRFARGTNVQLARVVEEGVVEAVVWERGAGETLASGSSACAVAAAARRTGRVRSGEVEVRMPGGVLQVTVGPEWAIRLVAEVEEVGWIRPAPALLARLAALAGRD